ncbi:acetyl-CoA C-acetyltransferase [Brevibacillus laterosporus]|nr:acetyl-CoA C-acetyltransferase [Brevibacillus laterosporus]TPG70047.1 acetyl-CoA C-acetyltransferase [Brevibacillus laterosporus]TPG85895.1 acetyl-CoA C-acetyltransferase [Brevibacillus laterosporus]
MNTVVVGAARTPFGKFNGALKEVSAVGLGSLVIREALIRAKVDPQTVDKVIMGMVVQAGAGQIPSRQAARKAGLPWEVTSETINKVCASSMRAVTMADQIIRCQDAEIIVAGGMESMSNAPYAMPQARQGFRMGDNLVKDLVLHDGLTCAFDQVPMAVHGSNVAAEYDITRTEQDSWAYRSQQRATKAREVGYFTEEIIPVPIPQRKGEPLLVTEDEAIRPDTTLEGLATLAPVYKKDGTITAGNAPGLNDGAGALVLMSEQKAEELGIKPLATILGHVEVAAEAPYIATTPGLAIQKLLQKTGIGLDEIDLFEVNEAFAAVTLTSGKIVGWDEEKVNVNGGAIALGHPIGASGARIIITLIHELQRRGGGLGIAAICSGAAQGDAILLRVESSGGM